MRAKTLIHAAATAIALVGLSVVPANASTSTLTDHQQATVKAALVERGVDASTAQQVAADPVLALAVPVSESYETTAGTPKEVKSTPGGGITIDNIGSTCSGYSNWVQRTQVINNIYGQLLLRVILRTDFCYNYSIVTYAHSSRSQYVSTIAAAGGWYFSSWTGWSEGYYIYNNHTNGGVKTFTEGYFQECVLKIGCIGSASIGARTYAHYDGTYSASGYSQGG